MMQKLRAIVLRIRYLFWAITLAAPYHIHAHHNIKPILSHHFLQTCITTQLIVAHNQTAKPQPNTTSQVSFSRQEIHHMISLSALLYASATIAWHAKTIYFSDQKKHNFLQQNLGTCIPRTFSTLYKHQLLLRTCLKVTIETLVFKCIAHCLVVCAYGSIFDVLHSVLKNIIPHRHSQ